MVAFGRMQLIWHAALNGGILKLFWRLLETGCHLTSERNYHGIHYYHFIAKQEWMDDPWDDVDAAGEWLYAVKEKVKPDIIHLNSYSLGNLNWEIPVVVTLHSCVLSWWNAVKKEEAPESWNTYHNRVKAGIQSANMVCAPSKYMLSMAEKYYGTFLNTAVIYNGRNRQNFRRGKKEKYVFSMGRLWDEAKNSSLIVKAAPNVKYSFCMAGEHRPEDFPELPSNIVLLGHLNHEQVSAWLSKAAVYALPAKYEPFGYTFLEAALSGCAIIGGSIPSLREIWGDAMIYVDPDNPARLAQIVNKVMEDDKLRMNMGEKAYKLAVAKYSLQTMLEKYSQLYMTTKKQKYIFQH